MRVKLVRDLTAQKAAETDLRHERELLQRHGFEVTAPAGGLALDLSAGDSEDSAFEAYSGSRSRDV